MLGACWTLPSWGLGKPDEAFDKKFQRAPYGWRRWAKMLEVTE